MYNSIHLKNELLINYFHIKKTLKSWLIGLFVVNNILFMKDNQKIVNFVQRYRSNDPSHDIEINMRDNSKIEDYRFGIQMIYFLLFYFLLKKKYIASLNYKFNCNNKLIKYY